jgi:hypothetical protein
LFDYRTIIDRAIIASQGRLSKNRAIIDQPAIEQAVNVIGVKRGKVLSDRPLGTGQASIR